ncbi:hypothetical protein KL930_001452 [Ogataea haglerorum]|nr:hypothetical protein KL951_001938 [Ogataea haglerorum]KAG7780527.1 hypothetical protein KL922_000878 [Ogataea haglerorum]KAG7781956.1 hypothetical protein KL930_001452 [Ogataea haglerorum]
MNSTSRLALAYVAGGLTLWPLILFLNNIASDMRVLSFKDSLHKLCQLAITYIVGGLTFLPITFIIGWHLLPMAPESPEQERELEEARQKEESKAKGETEGYRSLMAGQVLEKESSDLKTYHEGWLTVTREYYQFPQIDWSEFQTQASSGSSLGSEQVNNQQVPKSGSFLKMVKGNKPAPANAEEPKQDTKSLDAKKLKAIRKKNRYYAVLKHGNLFLYDDEAKKNVQYVIVLSNHVIGIWPRELKDGQLFTKRAAVCIFKKDLEPNHTAPPATSPEPENLVNILQGKVILETPPKDTFFLYADRNTQKEDWYFALLRATTKDVPKSGTAKDLLEPSFMARTLHFMTADMIDLIQAINSSEGQLTTQWLNALIGRLFLSYYRTEEFKELIKNKIDERLKKIRTPDFLDDLQIKKIDVGHSAPFLTFPKLQNLTPEGDLSIQCHVLYHGGLVLEVASKVFLNLGARFKQREFDINLKIVMKKLEGDILLRMKPPPSNRVWYGFTKLPEFDMVIEPVVSSRALNYNLITNIITNRFKEALGKTLVLPFMDDLVFYRTEGELFKGGIWDKSARPSAAAVPPQQSHPVPPPLPSRAPKTDDLVMDDTALEEDDNLSLSNSNRGSTQESTRDDTTFEVAQTVTNNCAPDSISIMTTGSGGSSSSLANTSTYKDRASMLSKKFLSMNKGLLVDNTASGSASEGADGDGQGKSLATSYSKLKGLYASTKQKITEKQSTANLKEIHYSPPEMISSRRIIRKTLRSAGDQPEVENRQSSAEMFAKTETTSMEPMVSLGYDEQQPKTPTSPNMFINERYRSSSLSKNVPPSPFASPQKLRLGDLDREEETEEMLLADEDDEYVDSGPLKAQTQDDPQTMDIPSGTRLVDTGPALSRVPPPLPERR